MSMTIASVPEAALLPAAATASAEHGVAATRKALDHQELTGRAAVQLVEKSAVAPPPPDPGRGRRLSRRA